LLTDRKDVIQTDTVEQIMSQLVGKLYKTPLGPSNNKDFTATNEVGHPGSHRRRVNPEALAAMALCFRAVRCTVGTVDRCIWPQRIKVMEKPRFAKFRADACVKEEL